MNAEAEGVKLFAVFMKGVYGHGCLGLFDSLDAAIARARGMASKDCATEKVD